MLKNNLYQEISRTYLRELSTFHPIFAKHFCIRMFRITGEKIYLQHIQDILAKELLSKFQVFSNVSTLNDSCINLSEMVRGSMFRNPMEKKRVERRWDFYQHYPRVKFFFEALSDLSFFLEVRLDSGMYREQIVATLKEFVKQNWQKELCFNECFLAHPVLFINSLYRLQEMGLWKSKAHLDDTEEHSPSEFAIEMVKKHFSPRRLQSNELLYDQIYSYTHLIINESHFYQQYLSPEQLHKLDWVFMFFQKHFHEFCSLINLDLVIEVLLCFRLANIPNLRMEKIGEEIVLSFYDKKHCYLKADAKTNVEEMEHAN